MAVIKLNKLKVGMKLAGDVEDINGRILLKTGVTINNNHLKIFKSWGIMEVDVQGAEKQDLESIDEKDLKPEILEKAKEEMTRIFDLTDLSHPVIKELFQLCTIRKAKSLSGKEARRGKKSG